MNDPDSSAGPAADLRYFFELSLDMLCTAGPDRRFLQVNPAFHRSLDHDPDTLRGRAFDEFVHPRDVHIPEREFAKLASGESMVSFECRYARADGVFRHVLWVWVRVPRGSVLFGVGRDLTDVTLLERRLLKMSRIDPLTGAATRTVFNETLESEWNRCRRLAVPLGVALVSIDDFSFYRNTYGHVGAEICLREVTELLRIYTRRAGDLVARIDETVFGLIWSNVDTKTASMLGERVRTAIAELELPLRGTAGVGRITVTIGGSSFLPSQSRDPDSLVTAAGTSLYEARKSGPNRVVVRQML